MNSTRQNHRRGKGKRNSGYPMYGSPTTLIPTRTVQQLKLDAYFSWGSAAFTSTTQNYFVVEANSIYRPFTSGINWSTSQNGTPTPVGGSAITQQFPGYSYLSGLYKYYKVRRSSLTVHVMPESAGDAIILTAYAYNSSSGLTLPLNLNEATQQLCCKHKVCAVGTAQKFNGVSVGGEMFQILGLSKAEWQGLDPTAVSADVSGVSGVFWAVQACTADGTNSGSTGIPCQMVLSMEVEFSNPNIPVN